MVKQNEIVAIAKWDFDLSALKRARGHELVRTRPEKRWFLQKINKSSISQAQQS